MNIDYHVAFDGNFYRVQYNLVQQVVEIRATVTTVEILHSCRGLVQSILSSPSRPSGFVAFLQLSTAQAAGLKMLCILRKRQNPFGIIRDSE